MSTPVHVLGGAGPDAGLDAFVAGLRAAGRDATLISPHAGLAGPATRLLHARAIDEDALLVPFARRALRAAPSVAHAFSLAGAYAAACEGRPLVLSLRAPVTRETVAARRLRLTFLKAALSHASAVTAPDEATVDSAARWLGVTPRILHPAHDSAAFAALYDEVETTA